MNIRKPEEYDALKEEIEKRAKLEEALRVLKKAGYKVIHGGVIPDKIPNTKDYLLD
jgi:hypothetical protein